MKNLLAAILFLTTTATQAVEVPNNSNWLPYWDNFQGTGNNYNIVTQYDVLKDKPLKYRVTCVNPANHKSMNTILHLSSAGVVYANITGQFKTADFSGKMVTPVTKQAAKASKGKATFNLVTYVPNVDWFTDPSYVITLSKKAGTPPIKVYTATMCGVTEIDLKKYQNIRMVKIP